ncbi:MAG: hypothetical protein ACT4TC_21760 [Myxococcaceae bacterium]
MTTQNNRIDPTSSTSSVRQSTNLTIDRQTPKTDFGDRVKYGLESAAGAVAQGAALAAPFVPGGAIVSAAVSSVGSMSASAGNVGSVGSAAVGAQYASGALSTVGAGGGGINTTVGANTGVATPNYSAGTGATSGGSTSNVGSMNSELIRAQQENAELMKVQISMQRENQVFSTVSNVLKTRHDTVKNTIANVR